jgi:hypothetical protein
MKSFKIIAGLLISLIVIGAITMLAIKYFDVLVRGYESLCDKVSRKKNRFFGGDCCDCDFDDDDFEEIEEV